MLNQIYVAPKSSSPTELTHWGRVTHICVGKLTIIGSDNGVAWTAPSHYLNQCWIIVNWTLRNKLQWNLNRNSHIFIQENAFESVVCETAAILSQPQCVNCPPPLSGLAFHVKATIIPLFIGSNTFQICDVTAFWCIYVFVCVSKWLKLSLDKFFN